MYDVIGFLIMMYSCCYVWQQMKNGEGLPVDYRKGNSYEKR